MAEFKQRKTEEKIRKTQLRKDIELECRGTARDKVERYLEVRHQGIIGWHHFAKASSECIYLYRDGYFIGAVMMSHAINEGIIKFVAERNNICKKEHIVLIEELLKKRIISKECAVASDCIWKSYRNDIHHMNPKVSKIPFQILARQNLKCLAKIEREIFGTDFKDGRLVPHQPKYWDINKKDGTISVFLRLE